MLKADLFFRRTGTSRICFEARKGGTAFRAMALFHLLDFALQMLVGTLQGLAGEQRCA